MISKLEKEAVKRLKELERRRNEQEDDLKSQADQVVRELVNIVEFKMSELFDENGALKPIVDQPEQVRKMILDVQVRFRRSGEKDDAGRPIIEILYRFKFHDKLKALHKLGRHVGAFVK